MKLAKKKHQRHRVPDQRVAVLQSFGRSDKEANPYVTMLSNAIANDVDVRYFSLKQALGVDFDVWHVHWPESLIRRKSWLREQLLCILLITALHRSRMRGAALVRTIHNEAPHERLRYGLARTTLRIFDHYTDRSIVMNRHTKSVGSEPSVLIPHGHYKPVIGETTTPPTEQIITYFGIIRPYKQVDCLLRAFNESNLSSTRLRVIGKCLDGGLRDTLIGIAAGDEQIDFHFGHCDESTLANAVRSSELVVLPYRRMHNSGAVIYALSCNRPVLVPRTPETEDLQTEFSEKWVHLYDGELSGVVLEDTVLEVRSQRSMRTVVDFRPERQWVYAAEMHVKVYRAAAENKKSRHRNTAMKNRIKR